MKLDLVADAKRDQAIEPSQRRVARCAVDDVALLKQKAREIGAVLSSDAGDEGSLR